MNTQPNYRVLMPLPLPLYVLLVVGLVLAVAMLAFRAGAAYQSYKTIAQQGRVPYASFEQVSSNGRLRSECTVFEVEKANE